MMRFAIASLMILGFAQAAPIPVGANRPALFSPIKTGSEWVYSYPSGEVSSLALVGTSVDKGERTISLQYESLGDWRTKKIVVSDEGLWVLDSGIAEYSPPLMWVKSNSKPGDKWEIDGAYTLHGAQGSIPLIGTITYVALEKVKVPAGEFMARRMEAKGARGWKETRWYAERVGLVKGIDTAGGKFELKSFTLGK